MEKDLGVVSVWSESSEANLGGILAKKLHGTTPHQNCLGLNNLLNKSFSDWSLGALACKYVGTGDPFQEKANISPDNH